MTTQSSTTIITTPPAREVVDRHSELVDVCILHWGWVTPGVPDCNRRLQEAQYLRFLAEPSQQDAHFHFTQPGWALDNTLDQALVDLTARCPRPGLRGQPFGDETCRRLAEEVREGRLSFVAYPYAGCVVEGVSGETALWSLRLTKEIAESLFECEIDSFLVHDGPMQLGWNTPAVIQIAGILGFSLLFGHRAAQLVGPDGSELTMLGSPLPGSAEYDVVEIMDGPGQIKRLRQEHGENNLRFVAASSCRDRLKQLAPRVDGSTTITKGWYGGTPLVMQAQAVLRRCEQLMPLWAMSDERGEARQEIRDMWKRILILEDCHLQWLLHDVEAHYLPLAYETEAIIRKRLEQIAKPGTSSTASHIANPLPFRRSGIYPVGSGYGYVESVPALGTVPLGSVLERSVSVNEFALKNDKIEVNLSSRGEILSVLDAQQTVLYRGRANIIQRWANVEANDAFELSTGEPWDSNGFCGNIALFAEVNAPADGEYVFDVDVPLGMTIAFGVVGESWNLATNRHWAGGLPSAQRDRQYTGHGVVSLKRGRNKLMLQAIADRGFLIQTANLKSRHATLRISEWRGRKVYAWKPELFKVDDVVRRNLGARSEIAFKGTFESCSVELVVSLDYGSERVDVRFNRHYEQRSHEGLQTLPLPLEIGSYLGSGCERPYVPALTVEADTWHETTYSSDKPYGYSAATTGAEAWHNGRFTPLFDGVSPFLGIDTAIAESSAGSVALLTDGHNHFFRRQCINGDERVGLSLGASTIHPATQLYKMKPHSEWDHKIGRHVATDYDDAYDRSDFVAPLGTVSCGWSWLFTNQTSLLRSKCHQERALRHVSLLPATTFMQCPVELVGEEVVTSAIEYAEDSLCVRLVNLSVQPQTFKLITKGKIDKLRVSGDMKISGLSCSSGIVTGQMPPLSVRELRISMATGRDCS